MRQRIARWARQRQGEDALPLTLRSSRIYILPTRAGVGFAVLLFLMLAAGLNYTNSLTLFITFLFAGFALISLYDCHRSLRDLLIAQVEVADSFAGQPGRLEFHFDNRAARPRQALQLRCESGGVARFELPAATACVQQADFLLPHRGLHALGRIVLASNAPLGLFRCWCWLHLPLQALVYPAPQGRHPLPEAGGPRQREAAAQLASGDDEWSAMRPFQSGDSPRSVAWKLYARGAPLLVSQYEGEAGSRRVLDFAQLAGLDTEARLSQLAAWIIECERRREPYALQLPQQFIAADLGAAQQQRALRALALHPG